MTCRQRTEPGHPGGRRWGPARGTAGWPLLGILLLLAGVVAAGCALRRPPETGPAARAFHSFADRFLAAHFAERPLEAVALGLHAHDGRLVVPTRAWVESEIRRLHAARAELGALPAGRPGTDLRLEQRLLEAVIDRELWTLEVQQGWRRNPMTYAGALDVSVYLKRSFKPLAARVADMTSILRQARALFAAARTNLDPVLPRPLVEMAIEVGRGTESFLDREVRQAAGTVGDRAVGEPFAHALGDALGEIRRYLDWLRQERLPGAGGQFALGREAFVGMLRAERIDLSPEAILDQGRRELRAEQERFDAAARVIDPTRPPIEVFRSIQREHPTPASLLADTRRNLERIRQFVVDRDLVTIPREVRARVEETLPPFRATSFASMDTPGPFERVATEAYYYVTPVEPDWTPAQQEEWLTALNYYTTDVVSIHEVYPGHYTQFLALNASRAGRVAKVFPSYSFAEGWAHYTEQMVLEAGFMQVADPARASRPEVVRAAKYRMAQSDEALLRLCRLCAAIRLHCQGAGLEEVTRFFQEHCHYEEKPARQEALRGVYDPAYLYYTLGKWQILQWRAERQAREGAAFSLKHFHDQLLSHGAPPLGLLRERLLADPGRRHGSP